MDYDNNVGYFMALFFGLYNGATEKQRKINRSKIHKYFLSFFRKWYYSALVEDTLLSPASFISEINKTYNKPQVCPLPLFIKNSENGQMTENVFMISYDINNHMIIEDFGIFIEHCVPDIKVNEELMLNEEDVLALAQKVSICDPFYIEYLNLIAINLDILVKAPSIHSHHARISEEFDKLYSLSNKEVFLKIYEVSAKISAYYIAQVIPFNKSIVTQSFILELLKNPVNIDDLFEKIYSSLGIDLSSFFELEGDEGFPDDIDDLDDEINEFYHMVMSSTFFLGLMFDKYFYTIFGFYLKVIAPEYIVPYDFESEFKFFLEVISEDGDLDTALFSPCTSFRITKFGKSIIEAEGCSEDRNDTLEVFNEKLSLERAMRMVKIIFGDEYASDNEVRKLVADIFGMPDLADVYEIKITLISDRKYWKIIEIIPTNPLKILFLEICAAFGLRPFYNYSFYMNGLEDIFSKYTKFDSKKPSKKTTEDILSDLDLPVGHKFLLVIDDITPIKFEIEIKTIKKYNHKKAYPNIVRVGQAFKNIE